MKEVQLHQVLRNLQNGYGPDIGAHKALGC